MFYWLEKIVVRGLVLCLVVSLASMTTKAILLEGYIKDVESMEAVNVLKGKYPREVGVITDLTAKALAVKGMQEGSWLYSVMDGYGTTHCIKYFYGKDGIQMLRDMHVDIEMDEFMSPEDCFKLYGIKADLGI